MMDLGELEIDEAARSLVREVAPGGDFNAARRN